MDSEEEPSGLEVDAVEGSGVPRTAPAGLPSPGWLSVVHRIAWLLLGLSVAVAGALVIWYASTTPGLNPWRPTTNARALVRIGAAALPALLAVPVLIFRPERGRGGALVGTSLAWTVTLFLAVASLWSLAATAVDLSPEVGVPVFDIESVDQYLAEQVDGAVPEVRVPTGVLIQSVEFLNANNVKITGFIWQIYGPEVPADVSRGYVLPEAADEAYQQDVAYQFTRPDGSEVIGWYVSATLRQAFDYRHYPFDRQDIWLRLWHRDFERGVVLVPDFASYLTLDPAAMAGLDPEFVSGAWEPRFTVFSYATNRYLTSFGYSPDTAGAEFPELYFNLGMKRDFWGPFFDHVTLGLAIAVLLFGLLILTTSDPNRRERFGTLTTAGVFGACTGLLFANLLEQNQIRAIVAGQQVAYMEILPFVLNVAIAAVAFNSMLLNGTRPPRFVVFRDNLLPNLLYWPALFGIILIATLLAFFR